MKRISMTYGQVLFELGIKKESLQKAQDMLHENEELLSALENPTITKKEKENMSMASARDTSHSSFARAVWLWFSSRTASLFTTTSR